MHTDIAKAMEEYNGPVPCTEKGALLQSAAEPEITGV
jgi:hypothetical protein